jgi:hypothetical protein
MNVTWHRKHRMPPRATLAQRVRWHVAHAKHCNCRPMPKTVQAALRAAGRAPARAKRGRALGAPRLERRTYGSMSKTKDVDAFLTAYPPQVGELAHAARSLLGRILPGAQETLDESAKVIGYAYGPGYKGVVCTLILSQTGVKLGIARGSELPDPNQLMQGSGKVHRHVQLRTTADVKRPGLEPLLESALAAWRERNRA